MLNKFEILILVKYDASKYLNIKYTIKFKNENIS